MKIKYNGKGPTVRVIGEMCWRRENGFLAEGPANLAADLITEPGGEFSIQEGDEDEIEEIARLTGVQAAELGRYMAEGATIHSKPRAEEAQDE